MVTTIRAQVHLVTHTYTHTSPHTHTHTNLVHTTHKYAGDLQRFDSLLNKYAPQQTSPSAVSVPSWSLQGVDRKRNVCVSPSARPRVAPASRASRSLAARGSAHECCIGTDHSARTILRDLGEAESSWMTSICI